MAFFGGLQCHSKSHRKPSESLLCGTTLLLVLNLTKNFFKKKIKVLPFFFFF